MHATYKYIYTVIGCCSYVVASSRVVRIPEISDVVGGGEGAVAQQCSYNNYSVRETSVFVLMVARYFGLLRGIILFTETSAGYLYNIVMRLLIES